MKLKVNFSNLLDLADRVGPRVPFQIRLDGSVMPSWPQPGVIDTSPPPETEIPEGGKEITSLEEIDTSGGLLSWQGQQVLLYIQDHRYKFSAAMESGISGNRVHVAMCSTLEEMRNSGRFDRYVITRDHGDQFRITGKQWGNEEENGYTDLKVCKVCLRKLNYEGYTKRKREVFESFSYKVFFQKYDSFFPYHPKREAGTAEGYTSDWKEVSRSFRAARHYKCEHCGVDASQKPYLIHTHHKNGVRSDNDEKNLKALCADCHSKEPNHDHMAVPHSVRQEIARLRREQSRTKIQDWSRVFALADPGLNGLLYHLKNLRAPLPEVGFNIQGNQQSSVASLELAWPERKVAVAISSDDSAAAREQGWRVFSVAICLERPDRLKELLVQ